MTGLIWKSGDEVTLASGSGPMVVVGYDSVGSVILAGNDERLRIYVTPSLLVSTEQNPAPAESVIATTT
jgi:hypothetical protein